MSLIKTSCVEKEQSAEKIEDESNPLVSIVIPVCIPDNIRACLNSIKISDYPNIEVIIVINSSSKPAIKEILSEIEIATSKHSIKKKLKIIKVNRALGFAAACNLGFSQSKGKYVLFLNDDTMMEKSLIGKLVAVCETIPNVVCVQPKILSFKDRRHFDYSGAAGGFIDLYGVPFCAGRIFETIEEDYGQYDDIEDICWASGACMLCKKSVLNETGVFQEDFFAHMEEIDLSLRILKRGYRIVLNPDAKIYHMSGETTKKLSINSDFLKYRNNLMMILTNFEKTHLAKIIIPRIFMDLLNLLIRIYKGEKMLTLNIPKAYFSILMKMKRILQWRKQFSGGRNRDYLRIVFPKSIAILYKLKGFRYFHQVRRFFNA